MRRWELDGPDGSLFSSEQVCEFLHLNRSSLYRLIKQGRFPHPRDIAGRKCWTGADLAAYLLLADRWFPDPDTIKPDAKKFTNDEEESE